MQPPPVAPAAPAAAADAGPANVSGDREVGPRSKWQGLSTVGKHTTCWPHMVCRRPSIGQDLETSGPGGSWRRRRRRTCRRARTAAAPAASPTSRCSVWPHWQAARSSAGPQAKLGSAARTSRSRNVCRAVSMLMAAIAGRSTTPAAVLPQQTFAPPLCRAAAAGRRHCTRCLLLPRPALHGRRPIWAPPGRPELQLSSGCLASCKAGLRALRPGRAARWQEPETGECSLPVDRCVAAAPAAEPNLPPPAAAAAAC